MYKLQGSLIKGIIPAITVKQSRGQKVIEVHQKKINYLINSTKAKVKT